MEEAAVHSEEGLAEDRVEMALCWEASEVTLGTDRRVVLAPVEEGVEGLAVAY